MKRSQSINARNSGFTLIEVIATLVVVGILSAFFIHFMGTALDDSWKSVDLAAGEAMAEGAIEQIIGDYVQEMNSDPEHALANMVTKVNNEDYNNNNPQVTVSVAYIDFDVNGNEIPITSGTSDLLKVIARAPGNDLTVILPKSRFKPADPIIAF